VKGACIQCTPLFLASAETEGWEWCNWIWELWQQHVQESSRFVGAGWSKTWGGCDRVAVVKFGVNSGSGDVGSCFGIAVWTNTAKLTNMVIARFGDRWDLVRKGEVFVEYKVRVSSRVRGVKRGAVDFGQFFTKTNEQKFSLRGVKWAMAHITSFQLCTTKSYQLSKSQQKCSKHTICNKCNVYGNNYIMFTPYK